MNDIIYRELTAEEIAEREAWDAGQHDRDIAFVELQRKLAYSSEADPLNMEWQATGDSATKSAWLAKREEIKQRFPYPESE